MSLPELQQNPLVQRVIDIFDTDENGEVDFRGVKVTTSSRPAAEQLGRYSLITTTQIQFDTSQ